MTVPALFALWFAPSGAAGGRGMTIFLLQMLGFIAIIYFFMIRPRVQQEKRHRERLAQIKRGDEVVTNGGLVGEVVHLKDDRLTIKTGEVRVVVERGRIAEVRPAGSTEEKKAS